MLRINVQLCVKKGCKTFILRQKYNFQEKQPLVEHAEQVHKYTGDTLKKSSPITECILTWYTFTVIGDGYVGKWRSISHYKKDSQQETRKRSESLAELYFLLIRSQNCEESHPFLPERKTVNMIIQQMKVLCLHQFKQRIDIFYVQCDVIDRT